MTEGVKWYRSEMEYLPKATNFDDMLIKRLVGERVTLCPLCQGHGGWNLRLNAYGLGKHFQAMCNQCWGWGHVGKEDATCIHDFMEGERKGSGSGRMFEHKIKCRKCGRSRWYDSSG